MPFTPNFVINRVIVLTVRFAFLRKRDGFEDPRPRYSTRLVSHLSHDFFIQRFNFIHTFSIGHEPMLIVKTVANDLPRQRTCVIRTSSFYYRSPTFILFYQSSTSWHSVLPTFAMGIYARVARTDFFWIVSIKSLHIYE